MEQNTTYEDKVALLIDQWKDSPRLKGIVEAAAAQAVKMEAALFEIRDIITLDNALGESLDFIGKVFDLERVLGETDISFRTRIRQRASAIRSGEPEAILEALRVVYGASFAYYVPEYPGKFRIHTDGSITVYDLQTFCPAGVLGLLYDYIIDAQGNYLVDARGNRIGHVSFGDGSTPTPSVGAFWAAAMWNAYMWPEDFWN